MGVSVGPLAGAMGDGAIGGAMTGAGESLVVSGFVVGSGTNEA